MHDILMIFLVNSTIERYMDIRKWSWIMMNSLIKEISIKDIEGVSIGHAQDDRCCGQVFL